MKVIRLKRVQITKTYADRFKNFNGWPTVATLQDGTLLAAWSNRFFHVCPFGAVAAAYSYDGGYTWSEPKTIFDSPLDDRDGGLCVWGDKVCLTTFTNSKGMQRNYLQVEAHKYIDQEDISVMRHKIESVTDEEEREFLGSLYAWSNDGGKTFGKFEKIPITAPHGAFVTADNKVAFIGAAFQDKWQKATFDYLPKGLYICQADEDGVFGAPHFLGEPNLPQGCSYCEPHAICAPDGRIVVTIRVEDNKGMATVYQSFSFDNGKTLTPFMPTGVNGAPPHLLKMQDGKLLLTYSRRCAPQGHYVRFSDDNGESWGEEFCVGEAYEWDQGYACTAQTSKGEFVTVCYQRDKGEKKGNHIFAYIWQVAKD